MLRAKLPRRSAYEFPAPRGFPHFFRQSHGNVFIFSLLYHFTPVLSMQNVEILLLFFAQNYFTLHKILCFSENTKTRYIIGDIFRKLIKGDTKKVFFEHLYKKKKPTCHPELVEVFSSEERGKTKAPKRRRDLVTTLGGLPMGCNICERKRNKNSTGRGAPWCSRKQTITVCKNGRSKPHRWELKEVCFLIVCSFQEMSSYQRW